MIILYIDSDSSPGHLPFNWGYISKLAEIPGVELNVIARRNYFNNHQISYFNLIKEIPDRLYLRKGKGRLLSRIFILLRYLYIKIVVDFKKYDRVFLSSYDEITLYFAFFKHPLWLINHNNITGLDNKIKRFFFKRLAEKHIYIVFENYMAERFYSIGIKNVYVIKHGLPEPFTPEPYKILASVSDRFASEKINKIIFCPSLGSDKKFINQIIKNEQFACFIERNKILFIVRGNIEATFNSSNILILNSYLTSIQYKALFLYSFAIVVAYPNTFRYRVSNVLNECISNNKLCFMSNIPALKIYSEFMVYKYYFSDIDELIRLMMDAMDRNITDATHKYFNVELLQTNFSKCL
jgi:hypothetical protein